MAIADLKELYLHGLKDLHSACKQSLAVTTELGRAAKSKELSEALISGGNGISDAIENLKSILSDHGENPGGEHCKGMEGLVAEARKHALEEEFGDEDAQDASIIAQYQRLCHYAITGYGTQRTWANRLGLDGDAGILQNMLDETREGDKHMTKLAEGGINKAAM